MTAPDPAWVEAGARALAAVRRDMNPVEVASDRRRREAAALLTAVEPLIREQIAAQIEARTDVHAGMDIKCDFCVAFRSAAAIARGDA